MVQFYKRLDMVAGSSLSIKMIYFLWGAFAFNLIKYLLHYLGKEGYPTTDCFFFERSLKSLLLLLLFCL